MRSCSDGSLEEHQQRELLYLPDAHSYRTIPIESVWHFIETDIEEQEKGRDDQIAFVARQGHFSSIEEIDRLSIPRFFKLFRAVERQLKYEADAARRARAEMDG